MPSSYWKHPIIVVFCPITRLSNGVCSLITLRTCHCEERTKWPTRQSTAYNGGVRISAVRLLVHSGSPRAFSPRDDKIWSYEIGDSVHQAHCHCEERTKWPTRQSTACDGGVRISAVRLQVHSGSPRAFSPRDDKNIIQPTSMQWTAHHLSLQKAQKETSRVAIHSQKIFSFSSIFIP